MPRSKPNPQIILRPQDLVVLLRLSLVVKVPPPAYAVLADELSLTASEIHAGIERAMLAQLARKDELGKPAVVRDALKLFVQHGVRYAYPATRGEAARGMPTGYAASPLKNRIAQSNDPIPVWPYKLGTVRGVALYPLYPTVPAAASRNPQLYELLVLVDGIRAGSIRERALSIEMIEERLTG